MGGGERAEGPASDLRGPPRDGACLQVLELDNLDVETRAEIAERYVGYRSYPAIDPVIMQVMPLPAQQHRGAALRCCCACALELGMHRDAEPSLPKPCGPCARVTRAADGNGSHGTRRASWRWA